MATVKRLVDLTEYAGVLPYASEMFGIYQPLLGWRSKQIADRIAKGLSSDRRQIVARLEREFAATVQIDYSREALPKIQIQAGELAEGRLRQFDSVVLEEVGKLLPPLKDYDPSSWPTIINADRMNKILKKEVVDGYSRYYGQLLDGSANVSRATMAMAAQPADRAKQVGLKTFENYLRHESRVAGALLLLTTEKRYAALKDMFYVSRSALDNVHTLSKILNNEDDVAAYLDLEHLDPTDAEQLRNVALSPVSVVHLFRQYFFELDTFLGPSERHVWLSPGSSVELYEVHTRRTMVERTVEASLGSTTTSESAVTTGDEIADAVKDDNSKDVKFGASVTANYASVQATSSFDYESSQKSARETTHKHMRQQTDKLSSEIRRNFKTTFRTTVEDIDVSSTRHLLANNTAALINYELRRKMRQVGVQVQDIGTYLCWQTYVDDPGRSLGLAKLVHIAKPAELDGIPHPEELPPLQVFQEERMVTIPFVSVDGTDADNEGEVYVNGVESDDSEFLGSEERIRYVFRQDFVCPKLGYELANVEFDSLGKPVTLSRQSAIANASPNASFDLKLDSVDFQGENSLQVKLVLHWSPLASANEEIEAKNKLLQDKCNAAEKAAFEKAAIETLKERVNEISTIRRREAEELRDEERIVIYRRLIQDMLQSRIEFPDDQSRHVVAELINAIFDVDKMLYFVSPEWWRPRRHRGQQQLAVTRADNSATLATAQTSGAIRCGVHTAVQGVLGNWPAPFASSSTVGWGGIDDRDRDNYFITDESEPARFGSSLGWLMQLDGDNMRNAFLNAPWVKAVVPIRPGKEEAALNWLKGIEGMNGITDDVIYHATDPSEVDSDGNPLEGQKMIDVLLDLAKKIKAKHIDGIQTDEFPKANEVADPALVDPDNVVTSTPIDRVYEHGFFPLEGGFRANVGRNYEIFDQWVEVLPTDQVVPVEVSYDPKTGRQI